MATRYKPFSVSFSEGQKKDLAKAIQSKCQMTLRLKHSSLQGSHQLYLTTRQINHLKKKAAASVVGADLKFGKTQIRKVVQQGGSLWSSLFLLGAKVLPTVGKALGIGALSGLADKEVGKNFGKGQVGRAIMYPA